MAKMNPNTTLEALHALADRASCADEPDRELDAEIWWAVSDQSATTPEVSRAVEEVGIAAYLTKLWPKWRGDTYGLSNPVPRYTDSIDAVRVLQLSSLPAHQSGYELVQFDPEEGSDNLGAQASLGDVTRDGATDAGAFLAAVLSQLGYNVGEAGRGEA